MTLSKSFVLAIFTLFMISSQSINLLYYNQIPVNRFTLFKCLLSMDRLKNDLDTTFNTNRENKIALFIRTKLTEGYLDDMGAELSQYDTVVIGENNLIEGQKNVVIGDVNGIIGSNNWVFSQGFNGYAEEDLILDDWQIEMDKAQLIREDPDLAIRKW